MQPSWHCSMPILPVMVFHWAQQKHNLNAILYRFPSRAPAKGPNQARCNTDDCLNQAKSDTVHSSPHKHFLTSSAGTEGQMDIVDCFLNQQVSMRLCHPSMPSCCTETWPWQGRQNIAWDLGTLGTLWAIAQIHCCRSLTWLAIPNLAFWPHFSEWHGKWISPSWIWWDFHCAGAHPTCCHSPWSTRLPSCHTPMLLIAQP